jgi:hypothetical protein
MFAPYPKQPQNPDQPQKVVHLRILGLGSDGMAYKDAEYSFTMPRRTMRPAAINVSPDSEAVPHVTGALPWVNGMTYLPMREYLRLSNGQQNVTGYAFLPSMPRELAELIPDISPGYARANGRSADLPGPVTGDEAGAGHQPRVGLMQFRRLNHLSAPDHT